MKYCKYCGHKIADNGQCSNPECDGAKRAQANQAKVAKAMEIVVPIVVLVALIIGIGCLSSDANKDPDEAKPSQSQPDELSNPSTTPTDPQETTLLHSSDLAVIKQEANEQISASVYVGDLLADPGSWTPVHIQYSGYFVHWPYFVTMADYLVTLVFEVQLVNPSATTTQTLYATVQYEAYSPHADGIDYLNIDSSEPKWHASVADWFTTMNADSYYETSFTLDEMSAMLGWDAYLKETAEISETDASAILEMGYAMLGEKHGNMVFDSACLYVANDMFSSTRNALYLYFRQTQEYEDGTVITYYFPLYASNIKLLTDESSNTSIDLASVVFVEEGYMMELPMNRGWVPLHWADVSAKYSSHCTNL